MSLITNQEQSLVKMSYNYRSRLTIYAYAEKSHPYMFQKYVIHYYVLRKKAFWDTPIRCYISIDSQSALYVYEWKMLSKMHSHAWQTLKRFTHHILMDGCLYSLCYLILTQTLFRYLSFLDYLICNVHPKKGWFPLESNPVPLAHQSHPYQATPVTLPGQ